MIPKNTLQNQSEKNGYCDKKLFEIEYSINMTPQLIDSLKRFCETTDISQEEFIDDLLKMSLEEIPSGINSKNYNLIVQYYDFSDLLESNSNSINKKSNEKRNRKITIKIRKEINYALLKACKIIRKVEPKKFIEDAIEYQFIAILNDVKRGEYEFLEKLSSFSRRVNQLKNLTIDTL